MVAISWNDAWLSAANSRHRLVRARALRVAFDKSKASQSAAYKPPPCRLQSRDASIWLRTYGKQECVRIVGRHVDEETLKAGALVVYTLAKLLNLQNTPATLAENPKLRVASLLTWRVAFKNRRFSTYTKLNRMFAYALRSRNGARRRRPEKIRRHIAPFERPFWQEFRCAKCWQHHFFLTPFSCLHNRLIISRFAYIRSASE